MKWDELKAMHAKMTPGEWGEDGWAIVRINPQSPGDHLVLDRGMTGANRTGIVALHNAFPAIAELFEAMRSALEAAKHQMEENLRFIPGAPCYRIMFGEALQEVEAALALADKPLTEDSAE